MRQQFDSFQVRAADDPPSALAVVLDTAVASWIRTGPGEPPASAKEAATALQTVTEQVLVFLNTFLLTHDGNRVYVILSSSNSCDLVYPHVPDADTLPPNYEAEMEEDMIEASSNAASNRLPINPLDAMNNLREAVCSGVKKSIDAQSASVQGQNKPTQISTAFARALCLLNRARRLRATRLAMNVSTVGSRTGPTTGANSTAITDNFDMDIPANGRVLAVIAGADSQTQYIPMMNCMFSAQRIRVPIDSFVVSSRDSTFLQQAAHVTNGVYLRIDRMGPEVPDTFLQVLQTVFLADRQSRDFVAMPEPESVDFRASCMRTRKVIEDGYTCSVCLSTFGKEKRNRDAPMCPVCNARYLIRRS